MLNQEPHPDEQRDWKKFKDIDTGGKQAIDDIAIKNYLKALTAGQSKEVAKKAFFETFEKNYNGNKKECPSCYGEGRWETECCNGAGGCSCRGGMVDMGTCNVCNGTGYVVEGQYNASANYDYIMQSGACFAGSGPSTGYWAGKPALGRSPKNI